MPRRDEYPEFLLRQILEQQQRIINELQEIKQQMATNPPITQAQFTADLASLQTALTQFLTDFAAEVAALKAANPGVDFTSLDTTVQTMLTNVTAADATTGQEPPPVTATTSAEVKKA